MTARRALHKSLAADDARKAPEARTAEEIEGAQRPAERRATIEGLAAIAALIAATIIAADELGLIEVSDEIALLVVGLLGFETLFLVFQWLTQHATQ